MKEIIKVLLIATGLTLLIQSISLASEQGHEDKSDHHAGDHHTDSKENHFDSEEEYVAKILALDLHVQELIQNRNLLKIHQPAFKARDFAKALLEKRLKHGTAAHQDGKKMASAVRHISQAAKLLDKYGDAEDLKKTKSAYNIFKKAINDIKSLYPKVIPSEV